MAREDTPERGLPTPEERRQILYRAGEILDKARDLMARLDLHESSYPRSVHEHQELLERVKSRDLRDGLAPPQLSSLAAKWPAAPEQVLAA